MNTSEQHSMNGIRPNLMNELKYVTQSLWFSILLDWKYIHRSVTWDKTPLWQLSVWDAIVEEYCTQKRLSVPLFTAWTLHYYILLSYKTLNSALSFGAKKISQLKGSLFRFVLHLYLWFFKGMQGLTNVSICPEQTWLQLFQLCQQSERTASKFSGKGNKVMQYFSLELSKQTLKYIIHVPHSFTTVVLCWHISVTLNQLPVHLAFVGFLPQDFSTTSPHNTVFSQIPCPNTPAFHCLSMS